MKFLFCIKAMDSQGGGAERVLAEVASGLAERGYQTILLSFDDIGGESFYELSSKIRRVRIGSGLEDDSSKPFRLLRLILIMRRIVRAIGPDVAVGFMHSAFVPLGIALCGTGIPVVASEHIVPQHYRNRPLQAALLHLTPFLAERITCVSEQVRQAFSALLRRKMIVMPNPVSTITRGRADVIAEDNQRKILLSVGRMDNQKDHRTLVSAFSKIADDCPDWDLRIVGGGELYDDLVAQIEELGLNERVSLPGFRRDIDREYRGAQLYVQPSRYESHGLTVVESLSFGLPAVGFESCLGVNTLIRSGENGLLVNGHGDRTAALANGLKSLMCNPEERLSLSNGGFRVLEEHGVEAVVNRWETLLGDIGIDHRKERRA